MNLLLDTHTFLWFVWADPQLSAAAEAAMTNAQNRKLISTASYWEIAIKVSLGKLDLGEPYRAFKAVFRWVRPAIRLPVSVARPLGRAGRATDPP